MNIFGEINETKQRQNNTVCQQDIVTLNKILKPQLIIVLGSSYSASLALLISETNKKIQAVIAFSPVEYLKKITVAQGITSIRIPVFATSSKKKLHRHGTFLNVSIKSTLTNLYPT